jgi:tRNA threonylcarbamoyladenosine biosynthesis protein TsaE
MHVSDSLKSNSLKSGGLNIDLPDEASTMALGGALAKQLQAGDVIFLRGDLGAGKTTLTRGCLRALGHAGRVKSPTYALVELYVISKLNFYHFDFYRFRDPEEWHEAGFRDLFNGANICLVEWPEKAEGLLPAADLSVLLTVTPADTRRAMLTANTPRGHAMIAALQVTLPPQL